MVDKAERRGQKGRALKLRVFRPFPHKEIAEALKHIKALAVMDRNRSFRILVILICSYKICVIDVKNIKVVDYIYGLGGRDIVPRILRKGL